jgi:hypothetical protein
MIPNKNLQVGRQRFSELFWDIIGEENGDEEIAICKIVEEQQHLREQADYKTGSVPVEDAIDLFLIVKYFQPKVIAEVGTFIGVSTMVMDLATGTTAQIRTCDVSNRIDLPLYPEQSKLIEQYFHTPSHEMFKDMAEEGLKVDLVYLDGRLGKEDIEPLSKIVHDDTIFVFDDFEGTEKGVANALLLERSNTTLVYPRNGNKTAILIPYSRIEFVRQEMT